MSVRAYMLRDIVDRSCEYAVERLRSKGQVMLADRLEGYPNIIVMVEAADRQGLCEAIMPVLGCIDGITENLHLLMTRDNEIPLDLLTCRDSMRRKSKGVKLAVRPGWPVRQGEKMHACGKTHRYTG
jgi:hypothetical protein